LAASRAIGGIETEVALIGGRRGIETEGGPDQGRRNIRNQRN
jgi:hypothetical protein